MNAAQPGAPVPSFRSLFNDILKSSSIYSVPLIAQRLASVILLPITTRYLTPADYGVLELLEQTGVILTVLLGGNFGWAIGYFHAKADSSEARSRVVTTSILGAAMLGAAASLVCAPFAGLASHLLFGGGMASAFLLAQFLAFAPTFTLEALLCWLRVADRRAMYVIGCLLRIALTVVGTLVLVAGLKLRVWGVLGTSLGALTLTMILLAVYCFRVQRTVFDARLFVRMAKFAAPIGLSSMAMFVVHFGDRFVLPHYRPMAELGIYALAYKLGSLLSSVYSPFLNYWNAQVFAIMKRDDAEAVFARLLTYVVLSISFCALGLAVCARPALTILAAPAFRGGAALVPVIVAAYFMRAIGDFVRCLFLAAGRPGFDAVCNWIGAAACAAGYLLLIPRYGMWGAAFATAGAFFVICVVSVVWTYRLRRYQVEGGRLAKIGFALAAAMVPQALLPMAGLPGQIASAALSLSLFPLALWLARFPTRGELDGGRTAIEGFWRRYSMKRA